MNRRNLKWILAIFLSMIALPCSARTLHFRGANVQCAIPDDWTLTEGKGCLLRACSPFGTRQFVITYLPAPLNQVLDDPRFSDQLETGITDTTNGQITGSGFVLMHDVRFRFWDNQASSGVATIYTHGLAFLGNNHFYGFSVSKAGDPPLEDAELVSILNSCNFIEAPTPHTGLLTFWDTLSPQDGKAHNLFSRVCYAALAILRTALIFFVPFALLLGVTLLFYRLLYGKRRLKGQPAVTAS